MIFQSKKKEVKKKKGFSKLIVILFLCLIFIFPQSSYEGAKHGLLLWFNTVLPTLLPFIIISNLIVGLQITKILSKIFYPIFRFLFQISPAGCYPILIGFLSGIPVGAKATSDLVERGDITTKEGQYLLSFCNNPSPMFIMSFIAITQLNAPGIRVHLLLINYLSAFFAALLYFKIFKFQRNVPGILSTQEITDSTADSDKKALKFDFALLDKAIMDGFEVITKVGGYIILFSIPAEIISSLSSLNTFVKIMSIGFLEITTGINSISSTNLDFNIKIVLIVIITAFGGLSGFAQTKSVINNTRLSIGTYLKSKLLHMLIAFVFATIYVSLK